MNEWLTRNWPLATLKFIFINNVWRRCVCVRLFVQTCVYKAVRHEIRKRRRHCFLGIWFEIVKLDVIPNTNSIEICFISFVLLLSRHSFTRDDVVVMKEYFFLIFAFVSPLVTFISCWFFVDILLSLLIPYFRHECKFHVQSKDFFFFTFFPTFDRW